MQEGEQAVGRRASSSPASEGLSGAPETRRHTRPLSRARTPRPWRRRFATWTMGAGGFGILVLCWYGIYWAGIVSRGLLPAPAAVFAALWARALHADLAGDIAASIERVSLGVVIGVSAALPVGFLLAWYRPIRAFADPPINFFRALPPIALIPLVVVYFGIGEVARVSVLVYASFFAAVVVIYEGIAATEEIYVRAARALGATDLEVFAYVVVPLAVPHFFVALRVALGVSWATLVAAELIAAQNGLGAVIQNASNFFQVPTIYGGIILIGISALVMDQFVRVAMGSVVRWQERVTR